ncbi:MAG TPA: ATP-binding cassette domain-containing protein [Methanoregulaceae archaeon]|nr:MAG: ATP-binding cassette domain-containing protein [Methanolinea sp.]HON82383.1 ATP-binding cassette domain-containing protein [Methanoregulaceae archaeon]HPD11214.1 ATP-binding cassette domain-containing protein [Methanoregulaceae archaeon]
MPSIIARHLTRRFGAITAVNDLSLTVDRGEIFGFLGPNGAGKTTTLRLLTGVLVPDEGTISIAGIDLRSDPLAAKRCMGIIPENSTVYSDLSALQNLLLAGKLYGLSPGDREQRAWALLSDLGLSDRAREKVGNFSKGMKQRVSIGCAVIHEPAVLFLDEPTSGLDVQSRRLVVAMIRRMHEQGSTIFLTTHNIDEANALCTRIGIINRGILAATDRPEVLKQTFDTTRSVEVSFTTAVDPERFSHPSVLRVEPMGDKFRIFTRNPDEVVKSIVTRADQDRLVIASLNTRGPSLEEAFLAITGES